MTHLLNVTIIGCECDQWPAPHSRYWGIHSHSSPTG